ncbi:MAG: 4Fe-4S binding protein [Candidatus Bathyarchaeota archaeon]|nr:4Fe-4S binding protein [Candidatus Bathyarchaeota archaeon]
MIISEECIGCRLCVHYCPMYAISMDQLAKIDREECVECGVCLRSEICPVDAFVEEIHEWPRSVRAAFSNPLTVHKETRVPGRGTEEAKTTDVTGRFKSGLVGITAEMGRPGVGVRFYDVEKVAQAMVKTGVEFADENPVTHLMVDKSTGKLNEEVLNEKVCSAMIESITEVDNIPTVIKSLKEAAEQIESVFTLTISSKLEADGLALCEKPLEALKVPLYINGKVNVGLGRPLFQEES